MTKYIRRPYPVEVMRFERAEGEDWADAYDRLAEFTDEAVIWKVDAMTGADTFKVYDHVRDTWTEFSPGDWIIKGEQGEFHRCKAEDFGELYEAYDG